MRVDSNDLEWRLIWVPRSSRISHTTRTSTVEFQGFVKGREWVLGDKQRALLGPRRSPGFFLPHKAMRNRGTSHLPLSVCLSVTLMCCVDRPPPQIASELFFHMNAPITYLLSRSAVTLSQQEPLQRLR